MTVTLNYLHHPMAQVSIEVHFERLGHKFSQGKAVRKKKTTSLPMRRA